MPRATIGDTTSTKSYIPKVSEIPGFSPVLAQFYKPIENRCIHEGRVVDQLYYKSNGVERMFTNVRFNCLFEINEPIIYLKEQTLYKLNVKIYSENCPTSGIKACVETLNKKNSITQEELKEASCFLAIPDEYLLKFHNVADAKSLWEAIKSRFGGNEESKKMQKNVLKHQFENFSTASNESLDKAYMICSKTHKSIEFSWCSNKRKILTKVSKKVYEDEMKRSSSSTSTSQNLAFLSSENTSSTNEVSTASGDFRVSTAGGISQVPSTPMAMLTIRDEKFIQKTGRNMDFKEKRPVSLDKSKFECYNCTRCWGSQDGLWGMTREMIMNRTIQTMQLMAISSSSSSSSSDNEIEKWEESSKNLDELLNSQMIARDKTGLGYGTQLNEMSNNSETDNDISLSVFDVRSSDEESTPANDRSSKADGYHAVPPPITGNFLTPRADISFTVYESVNRDKVSPVKTNETQTVKTRVDQIGQTSKKAGIGFKKIKACFVCKSTDHLIKDCDFYDKRSPEPKLKNVVNTGPRVVKPVWDNAKRKRAVHKVSTARPVSSAMPVSTARPVSTVRPFAPKIAQTRQSRDLLQDHAMVESGCSRPDTKGGKIMGKGKIRIANLDFNDVYFVDELKFNLFFVSQMCDKKNSVLFTETECLILSPSFKLLNESQVVLRAPRKDDVYSLDLKNIIPSGGTNTTQIKSSKMIHAEMSSQSLVFETLLPA
ncbi:hypothetical protein Tco_0546895 [Tanacetum coccineum]